MAAIPMSAVASSVDTNGTTDGRQQMIAYETVTRASAHNRFSQHHQLPDCGMKRLGAVDVEVEIGPLVHQHEQRLDVVNAAIAFHDD
jgi:hypothetical protein